METILLTFCQSCADNVGGEPYCPKVSCPLRPTIRAHALSAVALPVTVSCSMQMTLSTSEVPTTLPLLYPQQQLAAAIREHGNNRAGWLARKCGCCGAGGDAADGEGGGGEATGKIPATGLR